MAQITLLLSGGVESLVIAALASRLEDTKVHAVHVSFGQRPEKKEARAVREIARRYGLHLEHVEMKVPYWESHDMVDVDTTIVDASPSELVANPESARAHILKYRNVMLLSVASTYAATMGGGVLWTGFDFVNGRVGAARDKNPEFVEAFNRALELSKEGTSVHVYAPLQGNTKTETILEGYKLRVPWGISWSCYNDFIKPCGVCGSCVLRREGFVGAGYNDPVEYMTAEELS